MFQRLFDPNLIRVVHRCLIESVAKDEHVVDSDTEEQERDQVVDVCHLETLDEADAEAGQVAQENAADTNGCQGHATMDWTASSEKEDRVYEDESDCELNVDQVADKVTLEGLKDATVRHHEEVDVLRIQCELLDRLLQVVFVEIEPVLLTEHSGDAQ